MGRPSKLSPEQWAEVERRAAAGETHQSIAADFGVDEATIRRRVSPITPVVQNAAAKLVEARAVLAELPPTQQYAAMNLADTVRSISINLAAAASFGAKTSHRLQALANTEAQKIDDAEPLASIESLKGVALLTKMSNDSAHIPLSLVGKELAQRANQPLEDDEIPLLPAEAARRIAFLLASAEGETVQ